MCFVCFFHVFLLCFHYLFCTWCVISFLCFSVTFGCTLFWLLLKGYNCYHRFLFISFFWPPIRPHTRSFIHLSTHASTHPSIYPCTYRVVLIPGKGCRAKGTSVEGTLGAGGISMAEDPLPAQEAHHTIQYLHQK